MIGPQTAEQDEIGRVRDELRRFDVALQQADSATVLLARWMQGGGTEERSGLIVRIRPAAPGPFPSRLRDLLEIADHDEVLRRRVWLMLDGKVLSDADNYYVPARLPPDMRQALAATDVPFGAVVQPLRPARETLFVQRLWNPSADGAKRPPPRILHHRALMRNGAGEPLCTVSEYYTRNILSRYCADPAP